MPLQHELIDEAKSYVRRSVNDGVTSVSPRTLSEFLSCDESVATALLFWLQQEENMVRVQGYADCEICHKPTKLQGNTLEEIAASAVALSGQQCSTCGATFPEAEYVRVRIKFFFAHRAL